MYVKIVCKLSLPLMNLQNKQTHVEYACECKKKSFIIFLMSCDRSN